MSNWKEHENKILQSEIIKVVENNEFKKLVLQARKDFVNFRLQYKEDLNVLYFKIGQLINQYIKESDFTSLTPNRINLLLKFIDSLFVEFTKDFITLLTDNIFKTIKLSSQPATNYFIRLLKLAGVTRITEDLVKNVTNKNNKNLYNLFIRSKGITRKTTLSGNVWRITRDNKKALKKIIEYHTNIKSDPRELAKDVTGYLRQNTPVSDKLRRLIPGLPKNMSYEALRLGRSEMTQSFTESMYRTGNDLPGYKGITWLLSSRHITDDECTNNANTKKYGSKGFFPAGKEPRPPHPNCMCVQVQEFEDEDIFVSRLKLWEKSPNRVPSIQKWYNDNK